MLWYVGASVRVTRVLAQWSLPLSAPPGLLMIVLNTDLVPLFTRQDCYRKAGWEGCPLYIEREMREC